MVNWQKTINTTKKNSHDKFYNFVNKKKDKFYNLTIILNIYMGWFNGENSF
jgi:hypothetical protein